MKIFRRAAPALGLLGFGLLAAPLIAAPRSIKDCEKIQAADAYNQCLASFGPVAHLHGMKSAPDSGGDGGEDGGEGDPSPAPRHSYHRSHGRAHMVIDVGGSHAHRHWRTHRHHHAD